MDIGEASASARLRRGLVSSNCAFSTAIWDEVAYRMYSYCLE